MEYSFIGLYPSNLSSVPVRYGPNNEITRVTCSFSYDRYVAGSKRSFDWILGNSNNRDQSNGNFIDQTVRDLLDVGVDFVGNILKRR